MPARAMAVILGGGAAAALAASPVDPVVLPGAVSTAAAEVRIAWRPDGRQVLWGSIGRDGAADQEDVWEMHRIGETGWSPPARASFDTDAVEFDPAFSPDGREVYFHSDRPGGFGGTDLYVASVDPESGRFGPPHNLGPRINSAGDEWAPMPIGDGRLIFASDGWGGFGGHDLFEGRLDGAAPPRNLGSAINGPDEDFDAAVSPDGRTIVFSSGIMSDDAAQVRLHIANRTDDGWTPRMVLDVGCSDFVIGAAFDPRHPDRFYYAANCPGGLGRMDIHGAPLPAPASRGGA